MDQLRRNVVSAFPSRHFVYCFAYGSAVFRQAGRDARSAATGSMVDMIFAVDDPRAFHRDNVARNPGHYSRLRHLGPAAVAAVQAAGGARVYFNTHVAGVAADGAPCKYGVIDARDLRDDLRAWRTLYTAGRLHKPVVTLFDRGGDGLDGLIAGNLESAARAALLQLPARFAEADLYAAVAGLSYRGDFRMIVGEDRHKVANIVRPQVDAFRRLYAAALRAVAADGPPGRGGPAAVLSVREDGAAEQDVSAAARLRHLRRLPHNLLRVMLLRAYGRRGDGHADRPAASPLVAELAGRRDLPAVVRDAVWTVVFCPSVVQSLKGIPTAGLRNACAYSYEKLNKMVRSMMPR